AELIEVWNAAESCGYPQAAFHHLLILTATRRGEVASMRWRDVDLDTATWIIPPERSKNGNEHVVGLSTAAVGILRALPRFAAGDFIFSSRSGRIPINGFSKAKAKLDRIIRENRGAAGNADGMKPWVVHDLRRSVATLLARELKVPPPVLAAIL